MRIYWEDPNDPPPNAIFFPKHGERISTLPLPKSYAISKRSYLPDKEVWKKNVEKALFEIQKGTLEKIVLAREVTLELFEAPDPLSVVAALKKKAQNATLFCLMEEGKAFLGASPEKLFSRNGQTVAAFSLAGTRRRGKTPEEDLALEKALLESEKERREFSFLQKHLEEVLPNLPAPLPIVYKTANVQHLYSRAETTFLGSDFDLIKALHPTPALAGWPQKKALQMIRELEPFQRGLYGNVIGWSTKEKSDWTVAIRSCSIEGKTVRLYTGTGIVAGSDPDQEWDELNAKLSLYDEVFQ